MAGEEAQPPAADPVSPPKGREAAVMSVRGAAVWAMAGQYGSFVIQFAASVIISRFFLDPAEVGLFSIALAAAMLVAVLQDFGLSRYISSLPVLGPEELRRCSSVALLFSLVVAGVVAALAWPMAQIYDHPELFTLLLIISGSYLLLPLAVVPLALMARAMEFHRHFAVSIGGAALQGGVSIALAAAGFSAYALAWGNVAAALARAVIAQFLRPAPPFPLMLRGIGDVLSFGSKSSVLYLTGAFGTRTPDLLVGKLLGLTAVGLYSRAVSLSDQFRMLVAGAIGSVFFPAFARIRDRGEALGPPYLRVCAGYSAVLWPGMAALALASQPLVLLLYGERWAEVAPLLAMVALMEVLLTSLPLVSDLPILLGRMNRLMALNMLDTALSIGLLAIGCLWGVEGAAASRIIYGLLWLCIYAGFMHRLVGFDARALLAIYAKSALVTLATIAPMGAIYLFVSPPAETGFGLLLLATVLGGMGWLGSLWLLRHPAMSELLGMLGELPPVRSLQKALTNNG